MENEHVEQRIPDEFLRQNNVHPGPGQPGQAHDESPVKHAVSARGKYDAGGKQGARIRGRLADYEKAGRAIRGYRSDRRGGHGMTVTIQEDRVSANRVRIAEVGNREHVERIDISTAV